MRLLMKQRPGNSRSPPPGGRRSSRLSSFVSAPLLLRGLRYLAASLLVISVTYQAYQHGRHDPYKCESLIHGGRWHTSSQTATTPELGLPTMSWRPDDCVSPRIQGPDLGACLSGHQLVFAGDSTIRQLYWAALRRLDPAIAKTSKDGFARLEDRHVDLSKVINGVRVDFLWDPWLNSTALFGQLARFRDRAESPRYEALVRQEGRQSPALIVLGTPSLWAARNVKVNHAHAFKQGVGTVVHWLREDVSDSIVLPSSQGHNGAAYGELSNHVILVPVLEPAWDKITYDRQMMTPSKVDRMNADLRRSTSIHQSHIPWGFNSMTKTHQGAFLNDGIHVTDQVADQKLDMLLGLRCNAGIAAHKAPSQVTCCVPYPTPGIIQVFFLGLAFLGLLCLVLYEEEGESHHARPQRIVRGLLAASTLLVVTAYCFIADRTHMFSKQEKHFSIDGFLLSLTGLVIVFALSTRRVDTATSTLTEKPARPSDSFLSRSQTDEWKGWMQGFLLLYNFHGASASPGWYKVARLVISMYIFLSTYGHTRYFLRTNDFSRRRVVTVLCRINLLGLVLAWTMGSPWTLYYFCPLMTLWFLVTYATLSARAHLNASPAGLYFKLKVATVATTLLIQVVGGLAGGILMPLATGLGVSWDLQVVQKHIALDSIVPYFGIITAALAHRMTVLRKPTDPKPAPSYADRIDTTVDRILWGIVHPGRDGVPFKALAKLLSGIALAGFLIVAFGASFHSDNSTYDLYHPYVGPWLVLSAVILRNCSPAVRRLQVSGAVGLGRLSLETSILQHHILLAGDSSAILRMFSARFQATLPGMALRNCQTAILVVVFLWACVKCRAATQQITGMVAAWVGGEDGGRRKRQKQRPEDFAPEACQV